MHYMRYFHYKLSEHLDRINKRDKPKPKWTLNLIHRRADIPSGHFSLWKRPIEEGGRFPTDAEIDKILSLKELGLTEPVLKAWRAIDEYGKEVIEVAFEEFLAVDPEKATRINAKIAKKEKDK